MSEWSEARDFKPGDVAATEYGIAIYVTDCREVAHRGLKWHWHTRGGWVTSCRSPRPLVVIDPEDAAQVERLADCYIAANDGVASINYVVGKRLANALREFAAPSPPTPEEPLGLGAVVETAILGRWVRVGERKRPWISESAPVNACAWDEVDAVRVLSEGVLA